jgi:hypothetical protein
MLKQTKNQTGPCIELDTMPQQPGAPNETYIYSFSGDIVFTPSNIW